MFYGSIAQGFKGGGWDFIPPTPVAAPISFDPEHVINYELGLKSDYLDQRLRVNAAFSRWTTRTCRRSAPTSRACA